MQANTTTRPAVHTVAVFTARTTHVISLSPSMHSTLSRASLFALSVFTAATSASERRNSARGRPLTVTPCLLQRQKEKNGEAGDRGEGEGEGEGKREGIGERKGKREKGEWKGAAFMTREHGRIIWAIASAGDKKTRTTYGHNLSYAIGGGDDKKERRVELNNQGPTIHAAESHQRHISRGTSPGETYVALYEISVGVTKSWLLYTSPSPRD